MEILNNIWSLLTTENEFVTSIITFPFYFIETYLSLCIFTTFLKMDLSKKKQLIYVITISLVFILSNLLIGEPFNVIINYGCIFLLLFAVYKQSFMKSILAIILPFAIFGALTVLILNPFLKILNISSNTVVVVPLYKFVYLCCLYLIAVLIILIIRRKQFHFTLYPDLDKSTNRMLLGNLVLGIITLCMQAILTFYYINIVPIAVTLLNFILLFSYFLLSFYSLTRTMDLHVATRNLENAESYNNSLTVLYDNVKGFKHDFDNMLNTIGGYIEVDDMEGLKKYYSELKTDCVRVKNVQLLNPSIINNPGIYNLIVSKYQKATDLNIKINFEFFFDFKHLHMPIYEFSRILGILLDNAIDAAKECDEKEISLRFRDSQNHTQIIIVENTYSNKDVDTTKIFDKGVSGKENHSGIGLWEVKQIEKKFNNIVLRTSKDDKFFKQELEIRY